MSYLYESMGHHLSSFGRYCSINYLEANFSVRIHAVNHIVSAMVLIGAFGSLFTEMILLPASCIYLDLSGDSQSEYTVWGRQFRLTNLAVSLHNLHRQAARLAPTSA